MAAKKQNLWSSRFETEPAKILQEFNASIGFDIVMFEQDIAGSIAHSKMLAKQGIISKAESKSIIEGLNSIKAEIAMDPQEWAAERIADEDLHMAIEARLTTLIGDDAKKLHTARSRNDQVATDLRLYLRIQLAQLQEVLKQLRSSLIKRAKTDIDVIMPGYTHLQQAQAISLGHFWMAYQEKFSRDSARLEDALKRINVNPLGSGALAGSTFDIDRNLTTKELGFDSASTNSLDAVSDRDFVLEYEFCLSTIMLHLSQLAEEMIVWNSQEFNYIEISDGFATGSSMMPQKKNPDIPELLRGKAGRVIGVLNALMITVKGLPLSYNKDLQEDKEQLFMANETTIKCVAIATEFINNIKVNKEAMYQAVADSYSAATDIAEYLVKQGLAFRDAYSIVGQIVKYAIEQKKYLKDLSLGELQKFSDKFTKELDLSPEACVDARDVFGGTARKRVREAIKNAQN